MPYKKPVKKICIRCNDLFFTKGNRTKYCDECRKIVDREQCRKYRRLHLNYQNERNRLFIKH